MQGNFSFYDKTWSKISSSAKDLISSLLDVDPDKRPTADQVSNIYNQFEVIRTWP